jgi:hypothetical protein
LARGCANLQPGGVAVTPMRIALYSPDGGSMRLRALSLIGLASAVAGCADQSSEPAGPSAPAFSVTGPAQDLTNRWIVVFRDETASPDALTTALAAGAGATVHFRYSAALKGFAATIPPAALEGLRRNPNVSFIEADGLAFASEVQTSPPSWGLDRIDQRGLPLSGSYEYQNRGEGVRLTYRKWLLLIAHKKSHPSASSAGYTCVF